MEWGAVPVVVFLVSDKWQPWSSLVTDLPLARTLPLSEELAAGKVSQKPFVVIDFVLLTINKYSPSAMFGL